MSADLPKDLRNDFLVLEQRGVSLMRSGNYELAEKIFRAMLETIIERQHRENRRIHKGAFFYNIGFCQLLQERLMDALHNFLLAYVEDCINSPINQEDRADGSPASRVLREGFSVTDERLSAIKAIVRSRKEYAETLSNPQEIFQDFLRNAGIDENNLFALCSRRPELDQVRDTLVVNLTPKAKRTLDKVVSRMSNRVLRRATVIARKRQGRAVSENDVEQAIRELEEERK